MEVILAFSSYPNLITDDLSLHFQIQSFNIFRDLLGFVALNALLNSDNLTFCAAAGIFDLAIIQIFDGHSSFDEFRLQNVNNAF